MNENLFFKRIVSLYSKFGFKSTVNYTVHQPYEINVQSNNTLGLPGFVLAPLSSVNFA